MRVWTDAASGFGELAATSCTVSSLRSHCPMQLYTEVISIKLLLKLTLRVTLDFQRSVSVAGERTLFLHKLRSSYVILTDERNSYVLCYGNGYGNGYGTLEIRHYNGNYCGFCNDVDRKLAALSASGDFLLPAIQM